MKLVIEFTSPYVTNGNQVKEIARQFLEGLIDDMNDEGFKVKLVVDRLGVVRLIDRITPGTHVIATVESADLG